MAHSWGLPRFPPFMLWYRWMNFCMYCHRMMTYSNFTRQNSVNKIIDQNNNNIKKMNETGQPSPKFDFYFYFTYKFTAAITALMFVLRYAAALSSAVSLSACIHIFYGKSSKRPALCIVTFPANNNQGMPDWMTDNRCFHPTVLNFRFHFNIFYFIV